MTMLSPRQIWAYLELADQLASADRANDLVFNYVASQGDKKAIEKTIKELSG